MLGFVIAMTFLIREVLRSLGKSGVLASVIAVTWKPTFAQLALNPSGTVLAQNDPAHGWGSLWETENGLKLVTLILGSGLLLFFGVIAWLVRSWKMVQLRREYLAASRPEEHSVSELLKVIKRKSAEPGSSTIESTPEVSELEPESAVLQPAIPGTREPARPLAPEDWLLARGLERLNRELVAGRRTRKTCQTCRYASIGGPVSCPYAFSCGVLFHPRGNLGHALKKASLWFGFTAVLVAILLGVLALFPMKNQQRSIGETLAVSWPALLGLALLAAGISFVWHFWGAFKIRNQVRQAAKAATSLGLEFLNFQRLSLETGSLTFPLTVPGELNEVQAVMQGKLGGNEVFVGYYEYEWSERYDKNEFKRKMALARAAIGKEVHMLWGQLVMMFPEPLQAVPDFQLAPRKDIDYHLLREAEAVPLRGRLAKSVEAIYCLTSHRVAGYLFDETFQQFLLDHPGWNVQLWRGRLMLWHEKFDELSAEIIPGNAARLVSDLQDAATWRQMLAAKGRVEIIEQSLAEYRAATPPKKCEVVDERADARRKYAEAVREDIKPWQALALAIFFTCVGIGFAVAGYLDPTLPIALSLYLPVGLIPVVLLAMCAYIITRRA